MSYQWCLMCERGTSWYILPVHMDRDQGVSTSREIPGQDSSCCSWQLAVFPKLSKDLHSQHEISVEKVIRLDLPVCKLFPVSLPQVASKREDARWNVPQRTQGNGWRQHPESKVFALTNWFTGTSSISHLSRTSQSSHLVFMIYKVCHQPAKFDPSDRKLPQATWQIDSRNILASIKTTHVRVRRCGTVQWGGVEMAHCT